MRWRDIFSYRRDFDDPQLVNVEVNGRGYRTAEDIDPSLIIAVSFGKLSGEESSNYRLGLAVRDTRDFFGQLPVIAQREVYEEFVNIEGTDRMAFSVCAPLTRNTFLGTDVTTRDAFEEAKNIVDEFDFDPSHVLYVAHPAHIFRVIEMGKKVKTHQGSFYGVPFIEKATVYSTRDGQRFVRSASKFARRELLARICLKLKGQI